MERLCLGISTLRLRLECALSFGAFPFIFLTSCQNSNWCSSFLPLHGGGRRMTFTRSPTRKQDWRYRVCIITTVCLWVFVCYCQLLPVWTNGTARGGTALRFWCHWFPGFLDSSKGFRMAGRLRGRGNTTQTSWDLRK